MQMRDDMQSLLAQHVEHEEVVQTLIVEQQQHAQQVQSHVHSQLYIFIPS